MASVPVRSLALVALFLVFIWIRQQQAYDPFVHRISGTDASLNLSRVRYDLSSPEHDHFGYYNSSVAEEFCQHHGWRTFTPQSATGERKVYDLFMVNSELDWVEIRLDAMYDFVDYFIVIESSTTFQGGSKPLTIKENWARFARYHDKLIYHLLDIPEDFTPHRTWDYEDFQRDAMYLQVFPELEGRKRPVKGDVIIVADVDEILRPETLLVLRTCDFPRRLTLRSKFYYYSFQFLHQGPDWAHPQATFYDGARTILPVNLRNGDGGIKLLYDLEKGDLWNAGWHCSNCFATLDQFLNKLSSFSHRWMNHAYFRDPTRIAESVRSGKDLWGRVGELYSRIENNRDVPPLLLEKPENFRYLVSRDGPSAGFSDYP